MARRPAKKINLTAMLIIGFGLVLSGIAAILLLPPASSNAIAATAAGVVPVAVSYEAPALKLYDLQGVERSLSDYRGQVVLVNLWATWCPPCKAEMPTLEAYYKKYLDEGFILVAVNDGDPQEDVETFVEDYGLTFPVWLDPTYEATERAFRTLNLPSSFVIDRDGMVRLRWVGEIKRGALEEYVTPIILE